jgi:succinate dehydrogenase hydrophobic anchor subunit
MLLHTHISVPQAASHSYQCTTGRSTLISVYHRLLHTHISVPQAASHSYQCTTGCFTLISVYDGLLHTHISVRVMFIIEDTTVTVKCRTAIKVMFLYFNLCLSVTLNSLSCSFTSISFLTTSCFFTLICV